MHPITIRMDRVFDVQPDAFSGNLRRTLFSFESGGKRYFSILVDGDPKLVSGQTITALLKRKDDWQTVQGIVIHETSEIFAPSVAIDIWVVLLTMFIAGIFYMDLQFTNPDSIPLAMAIHALVAAFFLRSAMQAISIHRTLKSFVAKQN
jgi:hypothetical protein